jgi:hypothetical protein
MRPKIIRIPKKFHEAPFPFESIPLTQFGPMTQPDPPPKFPETPQPAKPRINTQIHRRQKAKAVPPMKDEWDDQSTTPPDLRTPSSKMKKNSK